MKIDRKKRLRLEERLKNYISPIKVSNDRKGNFLYYCILPYHYGVIGQRKARRCIKKRCKSYKIYREEIK